MRYIETIRSETDPPICEVGLNRLECDRAPSLEAMLGPYSKISIIQPHNAMYFFITSCHRHAGGCRWFRGAQVLCRREWPSSLKRSLLDTTHTEGVKNTRGRQASLLARTFRGNRQAFRGAILYSANGGLRAPQRAHGMHRKRVGFT